MQPTRSRAIVCLMAFATAACATVDPVPDYRRAAEHVRAATGAASVYQPQDEAAGRDRAAELLADGITADEAVELTLLNHPDIQAAFQGIGVSRADLVQAGLYHNPSLGITFRLPSGGGLAGLELGLAQSIADLWQVPAREAAAALELEQVILDVALLASRLGLEARGAYYAACAADEAVEVARQNEATAQELLELVLARQEAGAGTELEANAARSELLDHTLAGREARLAALEARMHLLRLLCLDLDPEQLLLTDRLQEAPTAVPDLEALLAVAVERRLDLQAGQRLVDAAAARLTQEQRAAYGGVTAGVEYEREPRPAGSAREATLGPTLEWELPLFDQNQAGVARAAHQFEQAKRLLTGWQRSVRQDVRLAATRARMAWETVRFYQDELLPGQQRTLELAREAYQLGKTSFLSVLEAQKDLLDARSRFIQAMAGAARATVDLELATGSPWRSLPQDPAGPDPDRSAPERPTP